MSEVKFESTNTSYPPDFPFFAIFPSFTSQDDVKKYFGQYPHAFRLFHRLPADMQQELLDYCIGRHGLRVTYDSVFQRIFRPDIHRNRLESLLSAILGRKIHIITIIPREGTQLSESGSFVIMDVLVQLDDGSYANIEMQKIGYKFPLLRSDCYAADIIMRQYSKLKDELGSKFDFNKMQKVYCIILMETSPAGFRSAEKKYIHRRSAVFDTGIYKSSASLHEDIFICLDIFHSIVHTITKDSSAQDAWLTFLSAVDVETISALISAFPMFASIYQEIAGFINDPKELISMFSEELYIMDRNTERLMVTELQDEVKSLKEELNSTKAELAIFKLSRENKLPREIADELNISIESVNTVLES